MARRVDIYRGGVSHSLKFSATTQEIESDAKRAFQYTVFRVLKSDVWGPNGISQRSWNNEVLATV